MTKRKQKRKKEEVTVKTNRVYTRIFVNLDGERWVARNKGLNIYVSQNYEGFIETISNMCAAGARGLEERLIEFEYSPGVPVCTVLTLNNMANMHNRITAARELLAGYYSVESR